MNILDSYERSARVYPIVIVGIVPFCSILFSFEWSLKDFVSVVPLGAVVAFISFLAIFVRNKGKAEELVLYKKWGGKPTTLLLLRPSKEFNKISLQIIREEIQKICSGVKFPSQEAMDKDVQSSCDMCDSAVMQLREKTRDTKKFDLLFKENKFYGFCRNLYGIRFYGVLLHLCVAFFVVFSCLYRDFQNCNIAYFIATANVLFAVMLYVIVNESFVKNAAFSYAKQLLASCNSTHFIKYKTTNELPKKSTVVKRKQN